ncbi:putative rIIB lysis inhibitor [Yersinia phage vB_YenM_P778]
MSNQNRDIQIAKMFKAGKSKAAIGRSLGVDESTVRRSLKRSAANGQVLPVTKAPQPVVKVKVTPRQALQAKAEKVSPRAKPTLAKTKAALTVREALESGESVAYIITGDSIILQLGADSEIVDSTHKNFKAIREAVLDGNFKEAFLLMNIVKAIKEYTQGAISVRGDHLYYGELEMKHNIVPRIMELMQAGDEAFKSLINFFTLLLQNPSVDSVEQTWGFISHLDVDIDTEGYIIGWKKVTSTKDGLRDSHTGKVPNDFGNIVEMPRFMVNSNRNQTCSQGLHVGAWNYVKGFSGDTIIKVRVHPADVVSVPTDYNDMKMRAAKYEVVGVVDGNKSPKVPDTSHKKLHLKIGQNGQILESKEI